MNRNVSKISCKRGFTLVELLVVVLIVSVLTAVAVPQYQLAVKKSQFAKMRTMVSSLVRAVGVYYLANNDWPHSFSELDLAPGLIPTTNKCVQNEEMYCCIQYPVKNNNKGNIVCGRLELSFGIVHYYVGANGDRINQTFCWEETDRKLCSSFPGTRACKSSANVWTPNGWKRGVQSCQID